ncbi:hypothetical protein B0J12DRAFT_450414 [Macrophomina phaseolina]|uniref:Uncharacterized protein n=1 Tax=Macrophomina phaseolina TaxID=35725 RepID=A0ABQ8GFB5_9PEZI|nr:hypothetical protein B0J12DRAFT_450414 [Macrophomina phaseolina]
MCTSKFVKYTCGCKKEMEFIQCEARRGSNVKCDPVEKAWGKDSSTTARNTWLSRTRQSNITIKMAMLSDFIVARLVGGSCSLVHSPATGGTHTWPSPRLHIA